LFSGGISGRSELAGRAQATLVASPTPLIRRASPHNHDLDDIVAAVVTERHFGATLLLGGAHHFFDGRRAAHLIVTQFVLSAK